METRTETSAGGVVYRTREDGGFDVALILTHEGRWQLPKGWVEPGEDPGRTAVREVREEAGVEATVAGTLDSIDYWFVSKYDTPPIRVHKHVHFLLMRYVSGSTDDHDDEVREARWFDSDEAMRTLAFKDERRMVQLAKEKLGGAAACDRR